MTKACLTSRLLNHYFFASYIVVLLLSCGYVRTIPSGDLRTSLFLIAVYLSYGFIYLLPAMILTKSLHYLSYRKTGNTFSLQRFSPALEFGVAVASTSAVDILLLADLTIFRLFGFHVNGFVLNLVTTPGGMESMGTGNSAIITFCFIAIVLIGIQAALLWVLHRFLCSRLRQTARMPRRFYRYAMILVLLLGFSERIAYGISNIQGYRPVMIAANAFPLYLPFTFRGISKKLGFDVKHEARLSLDTDATRLVYPLESIQVVAPEQSLNIVWMVAESWRWNMLDPEIMPGTWAFSQKGFRFMHHYSGGNGTRMGLFTMFYGLYGPYWFSFLAEQRSPIIIDILQDQAYQLGMYTSAKFSYPEFDKTIFAKVPRESLHEHSEDQGWKADRRNVTDLVQFIKNRDLSRPFMSFMFFESPHARYYFPEESVIREPYLQDFNYATMSLEDDIELIRNRYINSCHHLDSQFKRVLDFLEQEDLLKNTVVIITGDHGEEFMEKGRWGHNSEFHQEQIRVPLVLWVPGMGSGEVDRMTSHLDIPATLMPLIGVQNPAETYSLGHDLLGQEMRDYTIISDWSSIGYVGLNYKAVFPLGPGIPKDRITTKDDQMVEEPAIFFRSHRDELQKILLELGRFKRKG
ncbi:MAG: sulfatase-like hydrolase/transferase [Deltaproteobacteria bacterium]|nr:sulfatase-like hydrolase/transferase [Deltaproteobacteria bacterium]